MEARCDERDWKIDSEAPCSFNSWDDGWRGISQIVKTVDALNRILEEAGFAAEPPPLGEWEFFSLGTVTLYGELRQIHAGFVQPILRLPVTTRLPDRVIAFLTRIPGDNDWLKGENHSNLGFHYHYLNAKKERSDVALCWDTRAEVKTPHPLFQEKHGESRSKFSGRPDLWGITKRQSIHEACARDLKRWTLDKFRMACDKAGPVWPLGARLTAKPVQKAMPPRFPSKKGRTKRR